MIRVPVNAKLKRIVAHLLPCFRLEEKRSELFSAMAAVANIHIMP
ncbi:hypothetical protein ASAP_1750 [Asaia bogorensis]|uniref:Uncharacterized protein n=1 Tax=Asaia bogorensis TaxID=91915 RepID=A0A060QFU2_9PROT|nr:hypothetical protein ASAP_1750 [Asaia bogorensis]